MTYAHERDQFIASATKDGLDVFTARKLLRYATTLQRLAVAQCNGDWPADNGQRPVEFCPRCESGFVKSSFKRADDGSKVCPDCRTQELVNAVLAEASRDYWRAHDLATHNLDMTPRTDYPYRAVFQGDPRGAVLVLATPSRPWTEDGREQGLYVPARER